MTTHVVSIIATLIAAESAVAKKAMEVVIGDTITVTDEEFTAILTPFIQQGRMRRAMLIACAAESLNVFKTQEDKQRDLAKEFVLSNGEVLHSAKLVVVNGNTVLGIAKGDAITVASRPRTVSGLGFNMEVLHGSVALTVSITDHMMENLLAGKRAKFTSNGAAFFVSIPE